MKAGWAKLRCAKKEERGTYRRSWSLGCDEATKLGQRHSSDAQGLKGQKWIGAGWAGEGVCVDFVASNKEAVNKQSGESLLAGQLWCFAAPGWDPQFHVILLHIVTIPQHFVFGAHFPNIFSHKDEGVGGRGLCRWTGELCREEMAQFSDTSINYILLGQNKLTSFWDALVVRAKFHCFTWNGDRDSSVMSMEICLCYLRYDWVEEQLVMGKCKVLVCILFIYFIYNLPLSLRFRWTPWYKTIRCQKIFSQLC